MDRFDALEDEVKTLKVRVNDLEAENLEMAGKIEKLEVISTGNEVISDSFIQDDLNARVPVPSSCEEYLQMGSIVDGQRLIQPSQELEPFNMECQFNNGTATTIIEKTHEQLSGFTSIPGTYGCSSPGCFSDVISYKPSMEQITVI